MLSVPTPIEPVNLQSFAGHGIELHVKRDDLIHPLIIGNKLRKSLGYFEQCQQAGFDSILTFGGRYSNHLLAVAQSGHELGIPTVGIIRGTDLRGLSPVMDECRRKQMQIIAVKADEYYPLQQMSNQDLVVHFNLNMTPCIIREGGTSVQAIEGVGQIITEIADLSSYTWLVCPVGTGGTAAGLVWALSQRTESRLPKVLALSVLKGYRALPEQGQSALREKVGKEAASNILERHLEFDGTAPWGRYGKPSEDIMVRLHALQNAVSFPLDYVYTGKALLQLEQMVLTGRFARDSRLLFLHTGGYQTAPIQAE